MFLKNMFTGLDDEPLPMLWFHLLALIEQRLDSQKGIVCYFIRMCAAPPLENDDESFSQEFVLFACGVPIRWVEERKQFLKGFRAGIPLFSTPWHRTPFNATFSFSQILSLQNNFLVERTTLPVRSARL
jgi:hypothetical protein